MTDTKFRAAWLDAAKRIAAEQKRDPLLDADFADVPVQNPERFSESLDRETVKAWMLSKHATLWGRSITLHKEGVDEAIDFFISLVQDFEDFVSAK